MASSASTSSTSTSTSRTPTGSCRAGSECPYLHQEGQLPDAPVVPIERGVRGEMSGSSATGASRTGEYRMIQDRQQAVTKPVTSRVVSKPVPNTQAQDPREYQLGQIRRRYSPKEIVQNGGTQLKFSLTPSDPDFPFEISALECLLNVPKDYPLSRPSLKVGNQDIPRGFSINVEDGFDKLSQDPKYSHTTLLEFMKLLDKNLETFLSAPKAETVKLVLNRDIRHLSSAPSKALNIVAPSSKDETVTNTVDSNATSSTPVLSFTVQEKAEAAKRRESEVRQLEARMGRLPLYKKSSDGIAYTIPILPRRQADLPAGIKAVKSIQLFVPLLYPLHQCRIQLEGVDGDQSTPVEKGFEQKAKEQTGLNLMGHINYLAQNMHNLAKTVIESENKHVAVTPPAPLEEATPQMGSGIQPEGQRDPERSHIQYIVRPAEWTIVNTGDVETDSDDVYSYDTEDESEDGEGGATVTDQDHPSQVPTSTQEKGTALSFPFMELYGIELLEIASLNIAVKCERCKDATEIKGLKNGVTKLESCKKCAANFNIGFRRDFVHANATRAGFLDLEGCFVHDMLPSSFVPTCSQCSTSYPLPGIISVQGENTSNVCRECHQKFSFKIPSVKFLRITSSHLPPSSGPRRKKESLGITPGTELPRRGRCGHYAKSYRWFRFSCCQKVYPCDKCHDEAEEHPNEWANRMICGWCSKEGNYRPEDCGSCHGVLIGKKSTGGFWEGGKGTRDKVKMSRKDKRKFRRPGAANRAL